MDTSWNNWAKMYITSLKWYNSKENYRQTYTKQHCLICFKMLYKSLTIDYKRKSTIKVQKILSDEKITQWHEFWPFQVIYLLKYMRNWFVFKLIFLELLNLLSNTCVTFHYRCTSNFRNFSYYYIILVWI